MHYLAILRPVRIEMVSHGPTEQEQAIIGEHFKYLNKATEDGRVLVFGRTDTHDERTIGIIIFEADNAEKASAFMAKDPCLINGVMKVEILPYRLAGLSRDPRWHD